MPVVKVEAVAMEAVEVKAERTLAKSVQRVVLDVPDMTSVILPDEMVAPNILGEEVMETCLEAAPVQHEAQVSILDMEVLPAGQMGQELAPVEWEAAEAVSVDME